MTGTSTSARSPWFRHGFWNTAEHALTRVADILTTLLILRSLSPELFSKLALAQAAVAPLLLVFLSPETVLYRDFAVWKAEGASSLSRKVQALRVFAWAKAQAALVLSAVVAFIYPGQDSFAPRFWALIWAFALALGPQISGADREFLRLDLKLRELSFVSFVQKLSLFLGTAFVLWRWPGNLRYLALAAVFAVMLSALLARRASRRALLESGADLVSMGSPPLGVMVAVLQDSLRTFSVWAHFAGVLTNWVSSMDLLFLGIFKYPARLTGLYATGLKFANLSLAAPTALANLFSVWVGRRSATQQGREREVKELKRFSFWLTALCVIQTLLIILIAPFAMDFLSHGRWTPEESEMVRHWLTWLLLGNLFLSSTYLMSSWISVRGKIREVLTQVVLPWAMVAIPIYGIAAQQYGPTGVAFANGAIGLIYWVLLLRLWKTC